MPELKDIINFWDIIINYLSLQFVLCALLSALIITLVMILRRLFRDKVFLKGLLWSLLLITPFLGKLKFFYRITTDGVFVRLLCMWTNRFVGNYRISRIYFAGMLITAFILFRRRIRLGIFVKSLKTDRIAETEVYVCEHNITPFTTGVFFPKIVMPKIMLQEYREEEIAMILKHEKVHIRLGQLLYDLIWDVLHILMWINPLFVFCVKYFKADMEDVCDRIVIQGGNSTGYEYGSLLLKSIKLLQNSAEPEHLNVSFAFAGEERFLQIRNRVKTVAGYKRYDRKTVLCMVGATIFFTVGLLLVIKDQSYPSYQECENIYIYDLTGQKRLLEDSPELREAVSYDDAVLYIKTRQLKMLLESEGIEEKQYVVSFGGYTKLSGYGGGWCGVYIDGDMPNDEMIMKRYYRSNSLWDRIYKYM